MRRGDYRHISWSKEITKNYSHLRTLVRDIVFPYPTPPKNEMNAKGHPRSSMGLSQSRYSQVDFVLFLQFKDEIPPEFLQFETYRQQSTILKPRRLISVSL